MDIRDAIIQVDGLFNKSLGDRLIQYINSIELENLTIAKSKSLEDSLNIRNVKGRFLKNDNNLKYNNMSDFVFFQLINNEIFKILPNYLSKFTQLRLEKLIQSDLLKYEKGGKYEIHVDSFIHATRELTCIINLNDDYQGGDFCFFDSFGKKEIMKCSLKKGSVLFFPSNFLYPHKINPITEGIRYSVVSWLA
jgi:predicted 2-oxoglutarate/Fe(II)-dependent dioxygenase YbiX